MPSSIELADGITVASAMLIRWLRAADPSPVLSGPQASALAVVVYSGRIRMSDLARLEEVSRPTITNLAAELQRLGLIERKPDPGDGRVGWLSATELGRRILAEGQARRIAPLAKAIQNLPEAERAALADGLALLRRLLPSPSRSEAPEMPPRPRSRSRKPAAPSS